MSLLRDGFAVVEGAVSLDVVQTLAEQLQAGGAQAGSRGGVRNLLDLDCIRAFAQGLEVRTLVDPILGIGARVVRGILFDKTAEANWKVPWHQDVTIAVSNRVRADGYGPWSVKAGVLHVQPPASILEGMLTLRLHLDDCPEENGAVRVIPGTHTLGKLPEIEVQALAAEATPVVCAVRAGGVLLMRPLLLHASSAAIRPARRRVVHLDFASADLPAGMHWAASQA